MNIKAEDTCSLCNEVTETILHLFWDCEVSKQFWIELRRYINNRCGLNIKEWNTFEIIFGSRNLDTVTNLILLQAKLFLYYNKMKKQRPCFESFKRQLKSRYQIERYNAIKNLKLQTFEAVWENYKNLAHE